ncbi:MAG TPA: response regulator, partial [Armatimonadetes bacterium]|nr:response regulator [Armatimonadota bacterium]
SIRILVVDDEVALQEICRHHLTKAGYEVETASSGEEAVEKVAQTSFDLALMDYRLPGINGIEAFRQMREVRPGILGIIITGFGTMDVAVDALNQGFSAYPAKPVRREMLLNTVREVLARRQLELEKHRLEMLTHLYQEMEALLRCTDENTLSRTALDLLVRETHSDGGALIIREGDSWQVKASIGELDYEHLPQVVQRVIETGKRINLHGGPDANPAYADALRALNAQAYLALPIRVDGEPIGAMIVFQRDESAEYPESAVEHWSLISIYMGVLLERLRAMHEQHQVEQLATIGRMAAAIIHDLKNPISGIIGAAEIIEDMTPEAREMTRIIIREAQRLTDMVEEVLAYARGITEFHPEKLLVE